jgi:hypothetical protein
MGTRRGYLCENCGLAACVSGGRDRGFRAFTETFYCPSCQTLQDVSMTGLPAGPGDDRPRLENTTPSCRKCGGVALVPWRRDQACPRCEGRMGEDPEGLLVHWD